MCQTQAYYNVVDNVNHCFASVFVRITVISVDGIVSNYDVANSVEFIISILLYVKKYRPHNHKIEYRLK